MSSSSPTVREPPCFWANAGPATNTAAQAASASILPVNVIVVPPRTMDIASFFESLLHVGPARDSGLGRDSLRNRHKIGMAPADTADHAGRRIGANVQAALGDRGIDRAASEGGQCDA